MTRRKLYSKVGWRKYLDPAGHPRAKTFIEKNGMLVFTQVVECIKNASDENHSETVILVHPNVSAVVVIGESEYDEVLTHCLNYFKSKEKYEECGNIVTLKKQIKLTNNIFINKEV